MLWWLGAGVAVLAVAVGGLALRLRGLHRALTAERHARAEEAARCGELERVAARNSAILQNAMDGFFVLGADYSFLEVNDAFCRMTGYARSELLGMRMTDLEVAAPADAGPAQWRTGLHHVATAHRHRAGHVIQLESCVVVVRDGDTKVLVGFARDVTERWRAEHALRKSEAQYRSLVETSRDLIWTIDLDGRWTFVNNAARTIFGVPPEQLLGRALADAATPAHRAEVLRFLAAVRSGKPRLQVELDLQRPDGATMHLSFSGIPLRDERGQIVGCTGTARDNTEQVAAQRREREANERFAALVTRMPLGYVVWTADFRVLEWNRAAAGIFGYAADEAVGRPARELIIPPEGQKAFDEMCRDLLAGRPGREITLTARRRNGEKLRCEWYNTVLPDAEGKPLGVVTFIRDVTEREQLEAQLRQSQRLESLGLLAGGVAHDFNNLLVGILGSASLGLEQLPPDSPVRPLLEKVVSAGRRATQLTQRMLAYAGRSAPDVQIMDLNALVHEMAEFATAAFPRTVALRIDTATELPLIRADSSQIQQIIMNLLINAAEAIGERAGQVTVATRAETLSEVRCAAEFPNQKLVPGPYVTLEVSDNGCGMSPDTLSRIFDPFFTTKFAGRGLGLSAMLGIVRAHKGAVKVWSQEGVGTVFRVLLPAATGVTAAPSVARPRAEVPRGATVLVIDDEEDVRDVVQAVLESRGVRVLTAPDGQRGLEVFKQNSADIDAVLLDMNMPGLPGPAVFEELLRVRPEVKVLLSTGYSEQEVAGHFARDRLAGFVHKPYTASMLVDKIGAALTGN